MKNAAEAYKNAGLSANEYMETVTSFSASLIQSLGGDTEKAAEKSNLAITDMSDNANKMGTSMEAIQNAYNGFAKQNFTMLDNLKLGYGGTQAEMKRLIENAEKLDDSFKATRDENGDLTMSFGDIVDAVHIVQTDLGITGTTANEAATTISGSLGMMKSAWENVLTGVADDTQDFDTLIDNLVDSAVTFGDNIIPRVQTAIEGVGKLIEKLVPQVIDKLPDILSKTVPQLTKSATALLKSMGKAIANNADTLLSYVRDTLYNIGDKLADTSIMTDVVKDLIMTVVKRGRQILDMSQWIGVEIVRIIAEAIGSSESSSELLHWFAVMINDLADNAMMLLPTLLEMGFNIVMMLGQGIVDNVPWMVEEAIFFLEEFASYLADNAPIMASRLAEMVAKIAIMLTDPEAISNIVDVALSIITTLADSLIAVLPILVEAAPVIIENLVQAVMENFPKIVNAAGQLIKTLVNALLAELPQIIQSGKDIIDSLGTGMMLVLTTIDDACSSIGRTIKDRFNEAIESAKEWGKDLIDNFVGGLKEKWEKLKEGVTGIAQTVKDYLGFSEPDKGPLSNFHTFAPDMIDLFADGMKKSEGKLRNQLEDTASVIGNGFVSETPQNKAYGVASGGNIINITVTTGVISNDYDARRAGRMMSETLADMQVMENLSRGA